MSVEHVHMHGKGKRRKAVNINQQEKQLVSNYDILEKLGFSMKLIGENK